MTNKSKWFVNKDDVLIIRRDLAEAVGLEEAIVLGQLNYWLEKADVGIEYMGYKWIYNTHEEWKSGNENQEPNFPFWSVSTIRRIFKKLEDIELVVSCKPWEKKYDQKKAYRIDYEKLECFVKSN